MKDTPLEISTESTPAGIVIHVCGDVTSQGSVQVDEVVAPHLEGPGVPVVINLSKTTYMNSTALSVLSSSTPGPSATDGSSGLPTRARSWCGCSNSRTCSATADPVSPVLPRPCTGPAPVG